MTPADIEAEAARLRAAFARPVNTAGPKGGRVSDKPRETEAPCAVTGQPCRWLSDDETDDAGEVVAWDLFCMDCYRSRDWSKDEASAPATPPPPSATLPR